MRMPKEKLIELLKRIVTALEDNESAEGSISYEQGQADLNSYRVHANVRIGDGGFLIQ